MLFGAAGEDGGDAGDAEFGGLFDGPLHVIELEDGEEEMERKGGVGGELFVEGEVDLIFGDVGDLGAVEETVGDDVEDLAGGGAEDSGEMKGLVSGEGGGGGGPGVGDEAATGHALSLVCCGRCGAGCGCGVRDDFAGAADEDLLLPLMVEVDVEDGGAAMIPDVFGDGEVEEKHALSGLAGVDHGVAEEGFGGERFELGKGGVDVFEVLLFDGAGGDLLAVGGGEGGGEVLEEEGKVEAVVDAKCGEDVEGVVRMLAGDDHGVGFEDGVGGIDGGAGDGEVGGLVRGEAEKEREDDPENKEREEYRNQQVASSGLSELEVRHLHEDSKVEVFSGRLKQAKFSKRSLAV